MKRSRLRLKMTLIFAAFLVCALVFGFLMFSRYEKSKAGTPSTPVPEQTGTVSITLFFAAEDGSHLVREGRNIDSCGETADCIAAVVEELASGPLGELQSTVPPTTVVREARLENGEAVVDFEPGFAGSLPGGSSSEMMAVYSVVDSLAVNFPAIKAVRFLEDGKPIEFLKGHLDLRQAVVPDFSLEKSAQ